MLKLLDFDPTYFGDEPLISVLDFNVSGYGLFKKAADSKIESYASQIKPEEGKIYVHMLAMGAGEYYGANRNADYFPEENLIKYHDTFATSPAHIFKHHINKNPDIAMGKVIYSTYNDRMHRVEVIAWVDKEKGGEYVKRIEIGDFPSTSMACHTPFDTCAICGNKAKSRSEYCVHLRSELGKILPNGKKVMAINDGPLRFFDMSFVFKPADITSSVLRKVASKTEIHELEKIATISSIENAETEGLVEKSATIKKLSELIKEIEGEVVASSDTMKGILDKIKDPDDSVLETLVNLDLDHVIHALAELGISPSVSFFARLIGRKIAGESVDGIEHLVSGLLKEDAQALNIPAMTLQKEAGINNRGSELGVYIAKKALLPFVKSASLYPDPVMDRLFPVTTDSRYGQNHNIGYIGNGPFPIPDPKQSYKALKESTEGQSGLLKTLFLIGGAAIAAKWLLSKMIQDKVREELNSRRNSQITGNSPVKIVLVKSAQEAYSTTQLVKTALLRDLTQDY